MKIKGIFWKPGINGLGVRRFHRLPYRKRFDEAAREHDADYDKQGRWWNRQIADIKFLWNMVLACTNDLQVLFAILYYWMVRLLGWMFYRYDND